MHICNTSAGSRFLQTFLEGSELSSQPVIYPELWIHKERYFTVLFRDIVFGSSHLMCSFTPPVPKAKLDNFFWTSACLSHWVGDEVGHVKNETICVVLRHIPLYSGRSSVSFYKKCTHSSLECFVSMFAPWRTDSATPFLNSLISKRKQFICVGSCVSGEMEKSYFLICQGFLQALKQKKTNTLITFSRSQELTC